MKDENPIKDNLEEKFKELLPDESVPSKMKEEVFQTLDTLNLIGDIVDLFTDKLVKTEVTFFDLLNDEKRTEEEQTGEEK